MKNALKHPLFILGILCFVIAVALPIAGYTRHFHSNLVTKVERYVNKPTAWNLRSVVSKLYFDSVVDTMDFKEAREQRKGKKDIFFIGEDVLDGEDCGYVTVIREGSSYLEPVKIYYDLIKNKKYWVPDR